MESPQSSAVVNRKASQRCLLIPELLTHIFEYLPPHGTYSAARVCKLWGDCAVPTLWRVHPVRFSDLIKLLNLQSIRGKTYMVRMQNDEYNPDQELVTPVKWNRFLWFSQFVRVIKTEYNWGNDTLMLALYNLHSKYGGNIFPNLHTITAHGIDVDEECPFPAEFFHSDLQSLRVVDDPKGEDWISFGKLIDVLLARSPNIRELELIAAYEVTRFASFEAFQNLTSLQYRGFVTVELLQSFARCGNLQKLSLICLGFEEDVQIAELPAIGANTRSSVQQLELSFRDREDYLDGHDDQEDEEELALNNPFIRSKISFPSLRTLIMTDSDSLNRLLLQNISEDSPEVTKIVLKLRAALDPEVLHQLQAFKNLRELTFDQHGRSSYDGMREERLDEWLPRLPRLEAFHWTMAYCYDRSRLRMQLVNIKDVSRIIRQCSNLRHLSLPLQAHHLPSHIRRMTEELPVLDSYLSTSLRSLKLSIFDLNASHVHLLAKTLVELLPSSVDLEVTMGYDDEEAQELEDELVEQIEILSA